MTSTVLWISIYVYGLHRMCFNLISNLWVCLKKCTKGLVLLLWLSSGTILSIPLGRVFLFSRAVAFSTVQWCTQGICLQKNMQLILHINMQSWLVKDYLAAKWSKSIYILQRKEKPSCTSGLSMSLFTTYTSVMWYNAGVSHQDRVGSDVSKFSKWWDWHCGRLVGWQHR